MTDQGIQVCGNCGFWIPKGKWDDQDSMGLCPLTDTLTAFLHCCDDWVPEDPPGSKRLPEKANLDQYVYNKKETRKS